DADDLIAKSKLATQASTLMTVDDCVAVVFSAWQRVSADGVAAGLARPDLRGDVVGELLKASNFMQIGSQLFSRSWLECVRGFDERLRLIEDVELALRIA